jgi:hypothetical protein
MAYILHDTPPLPGDVRQREDGSFERYDLLDGWSADALAFQGPWNEWADYASGDVVANLHDMGGLWVCTDPTAGRWACIALPARENTP